MKIKFFTWIIGLSIISNTWAQSDLNSYKYIIVPSKFDFLKEKDQYQLNSLTQFLFNKYGFQALMEGENYPDDLARNRCLALLSDVFKDSGLFKTKLGFELKDCNDRVIYRSTELGESREKEYQKAYHEALRDAFKQIEALHYSYAPGEPAMVSQTSKVESDNAEEIKQLRKEVQALREKKEQEIKESVEKMDLSDDDKEIKTKINPNDFVDKPEKNEKSVELPKSEEVLYAQEIDNGFQLVDSTPKVVYKIKKTGMSYVFLVENKNATLYKKGEQWILEYYENNVLKQEELNIKF